MLLLRLTTPKTIREFILGDLVEEFHRRAGSGDPAGAARWFWREARSVGREIGSYRDDSVPLTPPRPLMHGVFQDLLFAFRLFGRRPMATAIAVATLGLGIGANVAIFSVVKPVLIDALPYPNGQRVVLLWEREPDGSTSNTSFSTFADLRAQSQTLDRKAAVRDWNPTLLGAGESSRLRGQRVSAEFLDVLGVAPALGRDFRPEEDQPGSDRVVILSHGLWRSRFGAEPAIVGNVISLDGYPNTVVGVMGPEFESLLDPGAELWSPLRYSVTLPFGCRTCRHLRAIGRLAPTATVSAAREEMALIANRLVAAYPNDYSTPGIVIEALKTNLTKATKPALIALLGAAGLVLLIACLNVANLALGQMAQRRQEFGVRLALGADRERILRQVLIESLMLGVLGAACGVGVAWLALQGIIGLAPAALPRLGSIGIDRIALGFAGLVGIGTGVAFGLGPALWLTRAAHAGLRETAKITAGPERHWLRRGLVTGEVAIAVLLVVGAGLVFRSMGQLLGVAPGFDPDHLLTMDVQVAGTKFDSDPVTRGYFTAAAAAAAQVPGVSAVAWTSQLPLGGNVDGYSVGIRSKPLANPSDQPSADRYSVTPGYFETMRIPLVSGRYLSEADRDSAPPVVVINATFARLEFPGRDPLGEEVHLGDDASPWRTIVGVVGDVRHAGLDRPATRQIYIPEDQWQFADGSMVMVVRTASDPALVAEPVRRVVRQVDPDPTIAKLAPMTAVIGASTDARHFVLRLFQSFAGLSLLLAAAGIYGVISTGVAERQREIGIRTALGASARGIQGLVVTEAVKLSVIGVTAGLVAAAGLSRFLGAILYGIGPTDPASFGAAGVLLLSVAIAAAWIPARRAARLDPTVILKD